jgi:hypothetical protein
MEIIEFVEYIIQGHLIDDNYVRIITNVCIMKFNFRNKESSFI